VAVSEAEPKPHHPRTPRPLTGRLRWRQLFPGSGPAAGAAKRVHVARPLLSARLPSGRGTTEQPNATGDGDAPLTPLFWAMVAATGVAAGLFGVLLMALLFATEHLTYGYQSGTFQTAVERVPGVRRVIALLVAGAVGGVLWYLLRRFTPGERTDVDGAVWSGAPLSTRRSLASSLIAELVIGMGASIGREAAPKLMGGVAGSVLARWARLSPAQRRLLIGCGAGAGLAAVYNVPLGGALFTAEVMCGSLTLPVLLPALACSLIATATSWVYLPVHATYVDIPAYTLSVPLMVWAVLVSPLIGVISVGYIRLIGWVSHHRARGASALVAPLVAFGLLGLVAIAYPQLLGNGKDMAQMVFIGGGTLALLAALWILKPLATSLCLGSGASGGLFTPTLSTGAVLGALLGQAWSMAWPGSPMGAYAMVGASAMIGAAIQAPLASVVLVMELTHSGFGISVPIIAATVLATVVSRHLDGNSIYSVRRSPQRG
jgi:CIC family chloride channel protein